MRGTKSLEQLTDLNLEALVVLGSRAKGGTVVVELADEVRSVELRVACHEPALQILHHARFVLKHLATAHRHASLVKVGQSAGLVVVRLI